MLKVAKDRLEALSPSAGQLPLALLASRMADGVVIIDSDAQTRFCNNAFARLIGRPESEVTGRPITDWLIDASKAEFATNWSLRSEGRSDAYSLTWERPDGTRVLTHLLPLPLFDVGRHFDGSLAIVIDATERLRLSEELSVAKAIIDQSSIVFYRARLEEGLPIEYVSGNVAHYGYRPESLVAGAVKFSDICHPEDYRRVLDELGQYVARGTREFIQRYRVQTQAGNAVWVEDHVCVRDFAGGAAVYLEGMVTDVTERRRAEAQLHRALTQTIGAVAATIDQRDPYTAGHQRRVANLARALASAMGLSNDRQEGIYLGALIHDVGKVAVPVDILARPGKLSAEEFALVKTHVRAGVEVLRDVEFPWPIIEMVAQHHERLDGSGYPGNLSGSAICVDARIIAVADVFESMSTHRPYRSALGVDAALAELDRGRGTAFDPMVVDACREIVEHGRTDLPGLWQKLESGTTISSPTANGPSSVPLQTLDVARD